LLDGVAPEATDRSFLDAKNADVHDAANKPTVISISWGGPEDSATENFVKNVDDVLQGAAALAVFLGGWLIRGAGAPKRLSYDRAAPAHCPAGPAVASVAGSQVALTGQAGHVLAVQKFDRADEARQFADDLMRYDARRRQAPMAKRVGRILLYAGYFFAGVGVGAAMSGRQQFLQHQGNLHAIWRGQRIELERMSPHRQLFFVCGSGNRTVDRRKAATSPARLGTTTRRLIAPIVKAARNVS